MRKHPILATAALIFLLGVVPVLVKQLTGEPGRRFTGVPVSDLEYVEVGFRNTAQGIDLGGLLFRPEGEGPFPAVVIIHGSGTSARNNGWYSTLVNDLVERGILVLLPDKRGSEQSGGDWRTASFEELATDTLAAVEFLAGREGPGISRLGVVGMSQGGWIAPIVANRNSGIDFLVSFSGATVTPTEQLYYEEIHNLQQAGVLPGIAHALAALSSRWIVHVGQRDFWGGIKDFDPVPYWREVAVDALAVFGEDDTNVPVEASIGRIGEIDNPLIRVLAFAGSGHAIGEPAEQGTRIIRPDASAAVADFILEAGRL